MSRAGGDHPSGFFFALSVQKTDRSLHAKLQSSFRSYELSNQHFRLWLGRFSHDFGFSWRK
jgi:hypothetical protein